MNYKQIGDNLSINDFNAFVSLLRNNIVFDENIRITKSNVKGVYGDYNFNFREATILDNGILITNETLSTIGTVKLVNPVFPNSNYYLDLKVYSSKDIGVIGLDSEDIIVTPLTIKLSAGVEVNIPFETLEMNNIIGFDATVRIDHKDLVIRGTDRIVLTSVSRALQYVPIPLSATYTDADGVPVSGKSINFYEGETLLGTGVTNGGGIATINYTFTNLGNHSIQAYCDALSSNVIDIVIVNEGDMKFRVNNDFITGLDPFVFTDRGLSVSFGDNTNVFYSSGKLSHDYASSGDYEVNIVGDITKLVDRGFEGCESLTSIEIPSTVTRIGAGCFQKCTGLTSVIIPDSITKLEDQCFFRTPLNSITIPNTVTNLGTSCFMSCGDLTSINIPSSVRSIGRSCFFGCANLNEIILNWTNNANIISYNPTWITLSSSSLKFIIPEGTTSLYVSKGYPRDKLKEDVSFDGISLTSDKSILSSADGDSATLTAQLTYEGSPVVVSGETVTFEVRKQSDDSLVETLTGVTDSSGIATVSYLGKAARNLNIKSFCNNIQSETYAIEDCKYYGDWSKITSTWTKDTSVTGRTIYKLLTAYNTDVELTFKLQNSIPSNFIVGFGETGGSPAYWNKLVFFRYNDVLYAVADNSNNISLSNPSISTDTIFKFTTSNLHSITGYLDGVSKITRTTNSGHGLNLRIDDFGGLDIEYLKVKPL